MKRTTVADADYNILSTDELIAFTSLTLNRQAALPLPGTGTSARPKFYTIKDESGNASTYNITVAITGGALDGAPSYVINVDYGSITVYDNGTNFFIISV